MLVRDFFINQATKEVEIETYIRNFFSKDSFSQLEFERTPLGVKITIYTDNPGKIIGTGGRKINELIEYLKKRFELENPQIDVKPIENPFLDAFTVAKKIATAIEKGVNYKKIGNVMLKRIMDAGAIGAEIKIAGKLGGSEKSSTAKFMAGYVKHCGDTAKRYVDTAFKEALTKPGKIGITVKIMKEFPQIVRFKEGGLKDGNNKKEGTEKNE